MRQKSDRKQGFGRKGSWPVRRDYPDTQQKKLNKPMTKFLMPVPGYTGVLSTPQIPPTELPGDVA
jgi:hypothetical protein